MKITTGIDIIEVERVKESIDKYSELFIKKIYTDSEIEYCNKSEVCKYERFAARFAAKEAIYKALNIDENIGIEWTDIEILKKENGRPFVNLKNSLSKYNYEISEIDVSLSHINETAVANTVISWK